jgi:cell division protein FtsN
VSVRRALPLLLAVLLGMSTALLAACGGGGTKGGIPSASAGELKSQITDVGQAVDGGRCDEVQGQLRQVDQGIDQLPGTTDRQLVSALRDGADKLRRVAVQDCETADATDTTTTETPPTETETTEAPPTDTTPTDTTPTDTTEAPPADTTPTPPPATTPTPPPVTPPPVTPPPPVPPPVTPGGGVSPDVGPG